MLSGLEEQPKREKGTSQSNMRG
jgi:hypothetical protein